MCSPSRWNVTDVKRLLIPSGCVASSEAAKVGNHRVLAFAPAPPEQCRTLANAVRRLVGLA